MPCWPRFGAQVSTLPTRETQIPVETECSVWRMPFWPLPVSHLPGSELAQALAESAVSRAQEGFRAVKVADGEKPSLTGRFPSLRR